MSVTTGCADGARYNPARTVCACASGSSNIPAKAANIVAVIIRIIAHPNGCLPQGLRLPRRGQPWTGILPLPAWDGIRQRYRFAAIPRMGGLDLRRKPVSTSLENTIDRPNVDISESALACRDGSHGAR